MGAIERFTESARRLGVEPHVRRFPEGTKTAADAAKAIGCDVAQIVKSLVFMADARPVIAFTSGANRVDPSKLARGGRRVRGAPGRPPRRRAPPPASPSAARPRSVTRRLCRSYVDPALLAFQEVWAAAGTPDSVFPLHAVRSSSGRPGRNRRISSRD